jgi:hypothetical protein
MRCHNCGKDQPVGRFCTDCGTILTQSGKKHGSMGWLIFWILICFPIAIVYAIIRDWSTR